MLFQKKWFLLKGKEPTVVIDSDADTSFFLNSSLDVYLFIAEFTNEHLWVMSKKQSKTDHQILFVLWCGLVIL